MNNKLSNKKMKQENEIQEKKLSIVIKKYKDLKKSQEKDHDINHSKLATTLDLTYI